jgi:hypothetical protein
VSYYLKSAFDAYTAAMTQWQTDHTNTTDQNTQAQADYDQAMNDWTAAGSNPPPPDAPYIAPLPQQPSLPSVTYEREDCLLGDTETIDTPYGTALVIGPRAIVTSSDGQTFATSDTEFDAAFVVAS